MEADIEAVEFAAIARLVERLTHTPYGADAARALTPAPDAETAFRMQCAVTAARHAIEEQAHGLGRLPDIRPALRQASSALAALSGTALLHIMQVLHQSEEWRALLVRYPHLYPGPDADFAPAPLLRAALEAALHTSGRIKDTASLRLNEYAAKLSAQEQVVTGILRQQRAALLGPSPAGEGIVTQGVRLLLSLPSATADKVKGVRRGPAGQGREYLVEPIEVVALNNRLESLAGERDAEELLVRRALTDQVREAGPVLERLIGALAWLDLAFAGGQLSVHMNASPPRFIDEPSLRFSGVYHPAMLLAYADRRGPQPIPLTIHLDEEHPMLLITGPNTGGKTVVLKTVGLLVVMAYCGLHVPSEGEVVVGRFARLIIDIGDRQSLLHQLSTFAGHVEVLKRLLHEADGDTLVLMDELGTGTDPEEGAALAMAVLDELARRQVRGVITTHLSPLKTYATEHAHLTNATMRFDTERLVPTYELEIGRSGSSHGLTIAERRGLPSPLLASARQHLARIIGERAL